MKTKQSWKILTLVFATFVLSHCASDLDKKIEEARFLLDQGLYTDVVTLLTPVAANNPNSLEAQLLLAQAQIGKTALGDGNTYLTLLSRFLEDNDAGQSDFATFARLAPAASDLTELNTARDSLVTLSTNPLLTDDSFRREVFFQLYLSRIFEVGGIIKKVNAANEDLECNADPTGVPNFKDGIPDGFDPNLITPGDTTRLDDDISNINSDGAEAGFPSDFALNARLDSILTDFNAALDAVDFLTTAFGDPNNVAFCVIPK